jgi:SET domain-containing protein
MKHLIIFIIIIIGFIILQFFNSINLDYKSPIGEIKISKKINGRGVIALKNYKKGDIIEICPCIYDDISNFSGKMKDYLFKYDDKTALVAFGYCSMYNHSDDYNALWKIISNEKIQVYATKDINDGDEIFISYGDPYWKNRKNTTKIN